MINIERLSFRYNGSDYGALNEVTLNIDSGEFVLLTGPSGSGKSTLFRCLNGLIPHFYGGLVSGRVFVDGLDVQKTPVREMATVVGTVFQDPENQLLTNEVESEIAFGLENLGLPQNLIVERIEEILPKMGLEELSHKDPLRLSGGEKQKVVIASVLAMKPRVLILDEPSSELDEDSTQELFSLLKVLNRELGVAIMVAEQRIERVSCFADRVVYMREGRIVQAHDRCRRRKTFAGGGKENGQGKLLVEAKDLHFSYDGRRDILSDIDLRIKEGELLVITGPNASGKTTLAKTINGTLKPTSGYVSIYEEGIKDRSSLSRFVGYVPQNPNDLLFEETVYDEVSFFMKNLGMPDSLIPAQTSSLLSEFQLGAYRDRYPRSLSGGEKERVAIASIVAGGPKVLILDEPTRGMDSTKKSCLKAFLDTYRKKGNSVVLITHDSDFFNGFADRVLLMEGGTLHEKNEKK
ncbi:MAG: energy-coupling factor ABC transporter ATP-binding protein [Candidatus Altiarchaeota archaeon]|nr:energy-coupling factor ABC transporter ATP-binding protein [Candidatus Altiarchaeota archaeon]